MLSYSVVISSRLNRTFFLNPSTARVNDSVKIEMSSEDALVFSNYSEAFAEGPGGKLHSQMMELCEKILTAFGLLGSNKTFSVNFTGLNENIQDYGVFDFRKLVRKVPVSLSAPISPSLFLKLRGKDQGQFFVPIPEPGANNGFRLIPITQGVLAKLKSEMHV